MRQERISLPVRTGAQAASAACGRYRAGLHYSNSYLKVNGSGYKEYGATLGVGFPMLDNRSFINASFEYVKIAPDSKALINEQYLRFTVSYTFNEYWFFKFKQD